MRSLYFIFASFCFYIFIVNVSFLASEKSNVFPKSNSLAYKIVRKNVIFPQHGDKSTEFFKKENIGSFWSFVGVSKIKTEDFVYQPFSEDVMPPNVNKACFPIFNLCAFWVENEDFEDFYFIDPHPRGRSIFDSTSVLLSPQLFLNLGKLDS